MGTKKTMRIIAMVLSSLGGINWGAIGLFGYNFVQKATATVPYLENIAYTLVGVATLFLLWETVDKK